MPISQSCKQAELSWVEPSMINTQLSSLQVSKSSSALSSYKLSFKYSYKHSAHLQLCYSMNKVAMVPFEAMALFDNPMPICIQIWLPNPNHDHEPRFGNYKWAKQSAGSWLSSSLLSSLRISKLRASNSLLSWFIKFYLLGWVREQCICNTQMLIFILYKLIFGCYTYDVT